MKTSKIIFLTISMGVVVIFFSMLLLWIINPYKRIYSNIDLPWVVSGKQTNLYKRMESSHGWGISSWFPAWGSDAKHREDLSATFSRASNFLLKQEVAKDWPQLPDYNNRTLAPYFFFLVSIEPTVILMKPAPELLTWLKAQGSRIALEKYGSLGMFPIEQSSELGGLSINPIVFGTRLPPGTEWQWFSPELNQAPSPLSLEHPDQAFIPLPKGKLTFHKAQFRVPLENIFTPPSEGLFSFLKSKPYKLQEGWQVQRE